jgi:glycosyltransferase involved in cell wall biosynthesis
MKALILSAHEDTGGVGIALKHALEKHTDWSARSVTRWQNYIEYPQDIFWPKGEPPSAELLRLWDECDVAHVMERWSAVDQFPNWRDKPMIFHSHGTEFRVDNTAAILKTTKEYGVPHIVSTIDLTLIDPDAEWLPNPVDIPRLAAMRSLSKRRRLKIVHSPTHRQVKNTDDFLSAVAGLEADVDLIEWTDHTSCLQRKARADIVFDQLHIGYALSAIEAFAMGIPVVSGAFDPAILNLMIYTFGYLPFYLTDGSRLRQRLEDMIRDERLRQEFGRLGRYHVDRWHDEVKVADQLVKVYERALR